MTTKSPEFLLFLLLVSIGAAIAAGRFFDWLVNRLHQWRNERALRRMIDRDDEPPLAI